MVNYPKITKIWNLPGQRGAWGHWMRIILLLVSGSAMLLTGCASGGTATGEAILAGGGGSILSINPATGNIKNLGSGTCPALSPDGRQIAFMDTVQKDIPLLSLYVMSSNGGNRKLIINKDRAFAQRLSCPSWLGNQTVLITQQDGPINRVDIATGAMQALPGGLLGLAGISPDGSRILFSDPYDALVYYTDAQGSGRHVILESNQEHVYYTDFAWSPDGDKLAYILANTQATGPDDVMVVNVAGGEALNLTNTPDIKEAGPVWSPDGSKIAFIREQGSSYKLCIINSGGGDPVEIAGSSSMYGFVSITWSPDGTRIAYASKSGTNAWNVFLVNVSDKQSRQVNKSPITADPALSLRWWPGQ